MVSKIHKFSNIKHLMLNKESTKSILRNKFIKFYSKKHKFYLKEKNKFKGYFLYPLITIISIISIYFSAVSISSYIVKKLPDSSEEFLWYNFEPNINIHSEILNEEKWISRLDKIQSLVDKIPDDFIPDGYKYQILIEESNINNAYAMPGGRIILTTSLIENIEYENSLIFVIGHELGHFYTKDHLYNMSRLIAANLMSNLIGSEIMTDLFLMFDNKDSRLHELEADKWGVKLVNEYYGHIGGIKEFFKILNDDDSELAIDDYISSHPLAKTRLNNIIDYAKSNHLVVGNPKKINW